MNDFLANLKHLQSSVSKGFGNEIMEKFFNKKTLKLVRLSQDPMVFKD